MKQVTLASILHELTSKTGVIAAIVVVVGLLVALQSLVLPHLTRRREASAARPRLFISAPDVSDLAEYGRVRELRFEVGNASKGTALMRSLRLIVTDHGVSDVARDTVTAAPLTVHTHRVELRPEKLEYDIRGPVFAPDLPPLAFDEGEVNAFLVKVVSREAHWFVAHIEAIWTDISNPESVRTTVTDALRLDFPPETREMRS